ncbi:hypothetical protein, partial [Clostridioides difficile]|uniref:hypothetical protein n=1 Tax=Clostridioides difficile TaxID=1496 RepID=UPI001142062D
MAKTRVNITITEETQVRILQYAYEHHLQGGLSCAIEHYAWPRLEVNLNKGRYKARLYFYKQRRQHIEYVHTVNHSHASS